MLIDWFEWTLEDSNLVKALVVEVEFKHTPILPSSDEMCLTP